MLQWQWHNPWRWLTYQKFIQVRKGDERWALKDMPFFSQSILEEIKLPDTRKNHNNFIQVKDFTSFSHLAEVHPSHE